MKNIINKIIDIIFGNSVVRQKRIEEIKKKEKFLKEKQLWEIIEWEDLPHWVQTEFDYNILGHGNIEIYPKYPIYIKGKTYIYKGNLHTNNYFRKIRNERTINE